MLAHQTSEGALGRRTARLRWYASRLRAMTLAEILHRVGEARTKRRWTRRAGGWDLAIGDGPVRSSAVLGARLRQAARLPGVAAGAQAVRAGHLRFLGRAWPVVDWRAGAGPAFWHHDPVTGRAWPGAGVTASTIDARSTGTDPNGPRLGDAKFVWEPGRLQFLHVLAAEGDTATALAVLRDFAETNPPWTGIHWTSGIEMALRLVSLTLVCAGCAPDALGPEDRILIRRMAVAHAEYLAAFPSLHSSDNNHRMAEGLGLFLAGLLVPDLGAGWERDGRGIVEDSARRLILADGGSAEQSPVYLAFVLEMTALTALLSAEAGTPLATDVLDRLGLGAAFLKTLLDETGTAPAIGDDDETRVIAQIPQREPRYVASVVAALAGLLDRPDLAPPDRDPHLRDALFASPATPGTASEGVRTFPQAGVSVARETIAGRRVHLVFDHGPMGYGALAAHGHADALAVWLSVDGAPVLIDAGTWLYFSAGAARLRLRESLSHNTVTLHGVSQSRASSAFGWANRAHATLLARDPAARWSLRASHDGYARRFRLAHERRVSRERDTLVIADRVTGGEAPAEIAFLLPGDLDVAVAGRDVRIARAGVSLCRLIAPGDFAVALRRGAGEGAVCSRAFGQIEDAQRLVFTGRLGTREAVTRLSFEPSRVEASPLRGDVARPSLLEPVTP
jgi:hypothetical protein